MAPISKSLALAGALFAAVGTALPVNKRANAVVWETVTDVEWTTVDVTKTVYPEQHYAPKTQTVSLVTAQPKPTVNAVPDNQPAEASSSSEPAPAASTPTVSTPTAASTPTSVPAPPPQQKQPNIPAPAPTTTVAPPPPAPTVAPQEPTTSARSAPPSPPSNPSPPSSGGSGSSGSSGYSGPCSKDSPCTGDITFYQTATSASAPSSCGTTNDGETENVLALPHGIMKDGDCGKTVTVKYGGSTTTGKVVDKCMGCDNSSIDLSKHFFQDLGSLAEGRISGVEWWMN